MPRKQRVYISNILYINANHNNVQLERQSVKVLSFYSAHYCTQHQKRNKIRREITMPKSEAIKYQSWRNNQLRRQKADREATVSAIISGVLMILIPCLMVAHKIYFG